MDGFEKLLLHTHTRRSHKEGRKYARLAGNDARASVFFVRVLSVLSEVTDALRSTTEYSQPT